MAVLPLAPLVVVCSAAAAPSVTPNAAMRPAEDSPAGTIADTFAYELPRLARRDRVPGASAALVHGGELVWEGAAGVVDRASGAAVTATTVFQVASLSKPVTALGVMLLAEEGRLDLDRPVWDYIDDWRPPASAHDASAVTARRLLSHRAGVGVHGYPGHPPDRPLPTLLEALDGDSAGAGAATLVAEPGSAALYSSGGYAILQLLIERVSGEPFASFIERRVLRPLGMNASSFETAPEGALATGHGWWGDALPAYHFREQAASGLLSTAGDVARFLALWSDPAAQRAVGVSPATLAAMREPGEGGGFTPGFALDAAAVRAEGGVAVPGPRLVWHSGSNRGFRAVLGMAPESGDAFVVLTNSDRGQAMTDDLSCAWGQWLTGLETASCWVERKRRGTMVAVAGLFGLGAVMDGAAFARRQRQRRAAREAGIVLAGVRHPGATRLRLAFALLFLAGWWAYWYTDLFARWREGIEHFVPVSSQPPTFFWLTVVVTAWCLLGVVRFVASTRTPAPVGEPR